jgi:hypothetical protein
MLCGGVTQPALLLGVNMQAECAANTEVFMTAHVAGLISKSKPLFILE